MFTIDIDPIVLTKLRSSYPKPPRCAEKALEKYRVLLEDLIFKSILRGRSAYEEKFNLYSIPVADLTHKGPQLNAGKERLHAWLKANHLELVRIVEVGNNLTGLVSLVKLTELVTLKGGADAVAKTLNGATSESSLDELLGSDIQQKIDTRIKEIQRKFFLKLPF